MARWEMAPLDTSSTCLVRTATAGSALTMKKPMSIPMGTRSQLCPLVATVPPIHCPAGRKPTLTPHRNRTSPR